MKLTKDEAAQLDRLCRSCRRDVIEVLHEKQTGHPGGSLSVCEILAVLFMKRLRIDPKDPAKEDRDRLVLSKGHAAPMLYRFLAEKGYFPKEEMHTLRDFETRLQGHPQMLDTPGVDLTSGPLGMGLSAALGMALSLRLSGFDSRVYCVLGDGEINEGTIWEACMAAHKFKADNLCAILDKNGVQLDGTSDDIMPLGDVKAKFASFGWNVLECDGHDVSALNDALDEAERCKGLPTVIIAHTVKGKGVSFMEGQSGWHGKAIDDESYRKAMEELGGDGNE